MKEQFEEVCLELIALEDDVIATSVEGIEEGAGGMYELPLETI